MARDRTDPEGMMESVDESERRWDGTSFLTGLLLGAVVGAGVALLLAPAAGAHTRRLIRGKATALSRDAADGWVSARDEARHALREKKEALRQRLARGLERVEEKLDV